MGFAVESSDESPKGLAFFVAIFDCRSLLTLVVVFKEEWSKIMLLHISVCLLEAFPCSGKYRHQEA